MIKKYLKESKTEIACAIPFATFLNIVSDVIFPGSMPVIMITLGSVIAASKMYGFVSRKADEKKNCSLEEFAGQFAIDVHSKDGDLFMEFCDTYRDRKEIPLSLFSKAVNKI